jgi:hypothetical protein
MSDDEVWAGCFVELAPIILLAGILVTLIYIATELAH